MATAGAGVEGAGLLFSFVVPSLEDGLLRSQPVRPVARIVASITEVNRERDREDIGEATLLIRDSVTEGIFVEFEG